MNTPTIYWYDLETFGIDARRDRIAQFAGIRTDENLNIISDPLIRYCKLSDEILPDPRSCLVTGITPSVANKRGLSETAFIEAIHQEFSVPNTCVAGYNNIRFDDEFIRNSYYRNFYDPYEREWKNGNSRWDIIDMVRLTRALRPEGIHWPNDDQGIASFRLEKLTEVNNIAHEMAHDAMSDVYATIALAKLIKEKQSRLFDFVYQHRGKQAISRYLDVRNATPVIHVSSKYPAAQHCLAVVAPLAMHPVNKNASIVYDLSVDPQALIELDVASIQARIFTPADQLKEGELRIPLKAVHINKCPIVVPLKTLDNDSAVRLGIDMSRCLQHLNTIKQHPDIGNKITQVFAQPDYGINDDAEFNLYAGFLNNSDRYKLESIRHATAQSIKGIAPVFEDKRLATLFLHYKARHYPAALTVAEQRAWDDYRYSRLMDDDNTNTLTLAEFNALLQALQSDPLTPAEKMPILDELMDYGAELSHRYTHHASLSD